MEEDLKGLASINLVKRDKTESKNYSSIVEGIKRSPHKDRWKEELIEYIGRNENREIYVAKNAFLIIRRFSQYEARGMYLSNEGHILDHKESKESLIQLGLTRIVDSGDFNKKEMRKVGISYIDIKESVIWNFFSNNYTHFMLDELAHLLILENSGYKGTMLILDKYEREWRQRWLNQIDIYNKKIFIPEESLVICKLYELIIPIYNGLISKSSYLSNKVKSLYMENIQNKKLSVKIEGPRIIHIPSVKEGVSRISNFDELVKASRELGEVLIWKPEEMDTNEKYEYLNRYHGSVLVCTGSGLMNAIMYKDILAGVLILVEEWAEEDEARLYGGVAYYLSIYDKAILVRGCESYKADGVSFSQTEYDKSKYIHSLRNLLSKGK